MSRSGLIAVLLLAATAATARAQGVEVAPFGGYRIGGSGAAGSPYLNVVYDSNGGVSFGGIVDVPYGSRKAGRAFEALFSRELSWIEVQGPSQFDPKTRVDVTIDHFLAGIVQELDEARGGAFIGGLLGVSRYAAPDSVDIRFTIGVSAGAKFFANRHVGLRLDARGYMAILSLGGAAACSGGCVVALNVSPSFQADFTAGLVIAF